MAIVVMFALVGLAVAAVYVLAWLKRWELKHSARDVSEEEEER
jgi:hypothetical protein